MTQKKPQLTMRELLESKVIIYLVSFSIYSFKANMSKRKGEVSPQKMEKIKQIKQLVKQVMLGITHLRLITTKIPSVQATTAIYDHKNNIEDYVDPFTRIHTSKPNSFIYPIQTLGSGQRLT